MGLVQWLKKGLRMTVEAACGTSCPFCRSGRVGPIMTAKNKPFKQYTRTCLECQSEFFVVMP